MPPRRDSWPEVVGGRFREELARFERQQDGQIHSSARARCTRSASPDQTLRWLRVCVSRRVGLRPLRRRQTNLAKDRKESEIAGGYASHAQAHDWFNRGVEW